MGGTGKASGHSLIGTEWRSATTLGSNREEVWSRFNPATSTQATITQNKSTGKFSVQASQNEGFMDQGGFSTLQSAQRAANSFINTVMRNTAKYNKAKERAERNRKR